MNYLVSLYAGASTWELVFFWMTLIWTMVPGFIYTVGLYNLRRKWILFDGFRQILAFGLTFYKINDFRKILLHPIVLLGQFACLSTVLWVLFALGWKLMLTTVIVGYGSILLMGIGAISKYSLEELERLSKFSPIGDGPEDDDTGYHPCNG